MLKYKIPQIVTLTPKNLLSHKIPQIVTLTPDKYSFYFSFIKK